MFLLIGLAAGAIAKMITPQEEKGGWVSSIIIGLLGAWIGNIIAGITFLRAFLGDNMLGDLIIATGGAVLLLWVYHKYLADKLNLPI